MDIMNVNETTSFSKEIVDIIRSYDLLQDRLPGDVLTLPVSWYELKIKVNDFAVAETINYSLDNLNKNLTVQKDLETIKKVVSAGGFLGMAGIVTDDHALESVEIKFDHVVVDGNEELCLVVDFKSDAEQVEEGATYLDRIQGKVDDALGEVIDTWGLDDDLSDFYSIAIMHNSQLIYV